MITIAYDHQIFTLQRFGGISRYICEIASEVAVTTGWAARIVAPLHRNEHLERSAVSRIGVHIPLKMKGVGRLLHGVNTLLEPPIMLQTGADLVHMTYYRARPRRHRAPLVITVHDMIHELFPESFRPTDKTIEYKQRCIREADKIICVSQSTANDLKRLFDVPDAKVSVTHLGVSRCFDQHADTLSDGSQRPYFLYVGERRGYKNFGRLLAAFAASPILHQNFDLVAFGAAPFTREELQFAEELRIRSGALRHLTGDDATLALAYSRAHLFIYPSEYEGFGIPPLEAMTCGCPVVCSNSSSIPEVVGDAGLYFEPKSIDSIREALEQISFDDERRAAFSSAGRIRSAGFTWSQCAHETLAVYREVLQR